jgi:hypothetical protein
MQGALLCVVLTLLGTTAQAQWLNYRAAGTPVGLDGKVDLSAPTPRAPEGKPDLTGVWRLERMQQNTEPTPVPAPAPNGGGTYTANIFRDMKPEE